jgi:hypothetical protein
MNLVHSDTGEPTGWSPDDLPTNFSPAVIEVLDGEDGATNYITVADVEETDGGHFRITEWEGRRSRLPAWRVCEIAYLQTRRESEDPEGLPPGEVPGSWREVREEDRRYVPPLDSDELPGTPAVGRTEAGP